MADLFLNLRVRPNTSQPPAKRTSDGFGSGTSVMVPVMALSDAGGSSLSKKLINVNPA